jgi:hypothetical protein
VDVAEQFQRESDAAQLGDERQRVDEVRHDDVAEGDARSCSFAHEVEHGASGDGGDASGHLGVRADADDGDDGHPDEREAEPGSDERVGDEVTDVHEPADRGEDAEREAEDALHVVASSMNFSRREVSSGSGVAIDGSS